MRLTEKVHLILEECVGAGDFVIDATAGNGHDTLKLAQRVGSHGEVWAIDLQEAALRATRARLQEAGIETAVRLLGGDHAEVLASWSREHQSRAAAIVFNLGYLPGGDKEVTTRAGNTVAALEASLPLLAPGAPLLVTAYRGHAGGQAEADAVAAWAESLAPARWSARSEEPPRRSGKNPPPVLWIVRQANG